MKKIISTILLLACLRAGAQSQITASITFTNIAGTTNGCVININGSLRFFTNAPNNSLAQILTNNTFTGSASNLYNQYLIAPQANTFISYPTSSNVVFTAYPNAALAITTSLGWCTVVMSTQSLTKSTIVRVPLSALGANESQTVENGLAGLLSDTAVTAPITPGAPAFTNFLDNTTSKIIAGANTYTGAQVYSNTAQVFSGGQVTNACLSNCVPALTSGYWSNGTLTNGQNFGNPFRSPGSASGSENYGLNSLASGINAIASGKSAHATGASSVATGDSSLAQGPFSVAQGDGSTSQGTNSVSIGLSAATENFATAGQTALNASAIGPFATVFYDNSTAVGQNSTTTSTNQVRLGTASDTVSIPGGFQVDGAISNATFAGSVTLKGQMIAPRFNNTALANGGNAAVNVSTNIYVKLSGPSGAFSIAGIAGGSDGRIIILQNSTGQTMTISNDSGTDPAAANRIYTGSGADVVNASNPGTAMLIYDSGLTRWILISNNRSP